MATHNIKAPPALSRCPSYATWLKEVKIWQLYTDIDQKKQGPAIFLTLEGKAREAILELEPEQIGAVDGVQTIVKKLDTLYKKDETQMAYEAYDNFEKFQRPHEMSMKDFIIEFERLLSKTKSHGTQLSENVLAYRILKSSNVSDHHQELVRATISELNYESMKLQLKKIFGDQQKFSSASDVDVKIENIHQSTDFECDTYYGTNYSKNYNRGGASQRPSYFRGSNNRGGRAGNRGMSRGKKGKNPVNDKGYTSRCSICESINHWAADCPDGHYFAEEVSPDIEPYSEHHVTLFQTTLLTEDSMRSFVSETLSSAILDSGATTTVSGKTWTDCYIDGLSSRKQEQVVYTDSSKAFKFGCGKVYNSLYKVKLPATIGNKDIFIETDVVQTDIPMLLSKAAMKKADTMLNLKDDSVIMFGCKQRILLTASGHYAIPLSDAQKIMSEMSSDNVNITLHLESLEGDKKKIANKLHAQFSHPESRKLIQLVKKAGMHNDKDLLDEIVNVSENCKICHEYKKPPPRPVVGLPLATKFNEVVAMDLKMLNGHWALHLIDHLSRYSAATFISSKKPEIIIRAIFKIWISVFGPPSKFLCDNGGEFNNESFITMCEKMNITVKTTAAESPWSNGLCERHNAILSEVYLKTAAEVNSDKETILCWAVHSKNCLANVHGFSPYQLSIGYTPVLPGVLNDKLPALEESNDSTSDYVENTLKTIATARKAFIQSEYSERIKRALRHNVRPSSFNRFVTGDSVYYKRMDSRKWRGPGKVIGFDAQQVLIKHGSSYVRVHPCRVLPDKTRAEDDETKYDSIPDFSTNNLDTKLPPITYESSSDSDSDVCLEGNTDQPENHHENPQDILTEISEENAATVAPSTMKKNSVPKIMRGLEIEYLSKDDKWIPANIVSRAGKATGKYKDHWNIERLDDNSIGELDFNQISEWRIRSSPLDEQDDVCLAFDMPRVFLSEVNDDVLNAKLKELENWIKEDVYQEVTDDGQKTISVRWVVTPKMINGVWSTKARLVARGFEEDSSQIRADSPTCMRETIRIMLTLASSYKWNVSTIDIKAAFLQGKPIERDVFLKPPKEAASKDKLWRLKKVVYGLSDASRVWYLTVLEELSKLKVTVSKFDKAAFFRIADDRLQGIIIVHVDDFLWAGTEEFVSEVIIPLRSVFKISKEYDRAFKYIGIDLVQTQNEIVINQKKYIDSICQVVIDKSVENDNSRLATELEKRQFKGVVGQLNWAASITRPDIAFNSCELSTLQSNPSLACLKKANKIVKDVKSDHLELKFRPLDLASIQLIVYSDASYGNLQDGSSQGGHMIFLSDNVGRCSPISWSSKRIKRVARSTLSAEVQAAVEALDTAYMVKTFCCELFNIQELAVTLFVDNKSLHDAVNTTNLISDKRLRIDIAAIREMSEKEEVQIKWVDTKSQIADVLTKKGPSKYNLLKVLQQGLLH